MSRFLVTGASGLIGRHAVALLAQAGCEVHAVGRSAPQPFDLFDDVIVRETITRIRPTHLLHGAWYTEHGLFWHAVKNADWLEASKTLISTFVQAGGKRVLGVGTCAEYDWLRTDASPWKEGDDLAPLTAYGRAKNELHQWLAEQGIDYAWARLFLLFGRGENSARIVPYLLRCALSGEVARCSSGGKVRDFLSTRACGERLAVLAMSNLKGAVNIASGQGLSLSELQSCIETATGKTLHVDFGAIPDRSGDPCYMVADVTRMNTLPVPSFDFERSLMDYARSFASLSQG